MVAALGGYVTKHQTRWRERIGAEEYENFQRLLLLDAIDRAWSPLYTDYKLLGDKIGSLQNMRQSANRMALNSGQHHVLSDRGIEGQ